MWHHKGVTLPLGGMRSTQSSPMRYTEPLGHTKEPLPVPPWCSTRSSAPSPYTSRRPYGFIIKTKEEEEERRVRLEKRLLPNFDFDDALQVLDCTQILINLGWVQFFMELVWILTRSLIQKSLYISTGNRWRSVMPLISLWRWRATSSL
jgi:hypothetical protein